MTTNREKLNLYQGYRANIDLLINCIDDLQQEINELRTEIAVLKQQKNQQQPIKAIGYHDVEKFYTEEK